MARPKLSGPTRGRVNLSFDPAIYAQMRISANELNLSVSAYLEKLHSEQEARKLSQKDAVKNFGKVGTRKVKSALRVSIVTDSGE